MAGVLGKIAPHAQVFKPVEKQLCTRSFPAIIEAVAETGVPFALFSNSHWRDPTAGASTSFDPTHLHRAAHLSTRPGHSSPRRLHPHPGSFAETCENIRRATAVGLRVHTSTVITRYNWQCSAEIVSLSQQLGAKRAIFNRYLGPPMPDLWNQQMTSCATPCEILKD